jgi:hypothetical protein
MFRFQVLLMTSSRHEFRSVPVARGITWFRSHDLPSSPVPAPLLNGPRSQVPGPSADGRLCRPRGFSKCNRLKTTSISGLLIGVLEILQLWSRDGTHGCRILWWMRWRPELDLRWRPRSTGLSGERRTSELPDT